MLPSQVYCPRCQQVVAVDEWRRLPVPPDHLPAYQARHRRRDGSNCRFYTGPPVVSVEALDRVVVD